MSELVEFHIDILSTIHRVLLRTAHDIRTEYILPNHKRADIITISPNNIIRIIEVKSVITPSIVQSAINKYMGYCNELYIAVPAAEYTRQVSYGRVIDANHVYNAVGWIKVYPDHIEIRSPPPRRRIAPSLFALIAGPLTKHDEPDDRTFLDRKELR